MKEFKTTKGTTLQIIELKGKDYMMVNQRLIWFREERPDWMIETSIHTLTTDTAVFRAVIRDDSGQPVATAHKRETQKDFPDFIEKAETGSIGRALLFCGYGTAFAANELDEKDRLADAPVQAKQMSVAPSYYEEDDSRPAVLELGSYESTNKRTYDSPLKSVTTPKTVPTPAIVSNYQVKFGKFKGKLLSDIGPDILKGYLNYMKGGPESDTLKGPAKEFYEKGSQYLKSLSGN